MENLLNDTPKGNRVHISFFGKRNSGKSSLLNAFTNQSISIVSNEKGTTTDPVYKAMELSGVGACMLVDTAGFDDENTLGNLRIQKTKEVVLKTDIAILIFADGEITIEKDWIKFLKDKNIPIIYVLNKIDGMKDSDVIKEKIKKEFKIEPLLISAKEKIGIDNLQDKIREIYKNIEDEKISILGNLVKKDDTVLLVMPQNIQAPKGRLILPQVQTIRELLDRKCTVICTGVDTFQKSLDSLKNSPDLIVTDSQEFNFVYPLCPKTSKLTSFSILFSAYKGDLQYFLEGIETLKNLNEKSKILISEICTHVPLSEDIGRVKIPNLLRKTYGEKIFIDIISGNDFPSDIEKYSLIIQCGGCMFTRRQILSRIQIAKEKHIPMTNYGLTLAYLMNVPLKNLSMP